MGQFHKTTSLVPSKDPNMGGKKKQWGCSNLKRLKNIKENKIPGINLTKEVKDLYTTDERN